MAVNLVIVERFGGLRLDRAVEEVGAEAAVALSNVDVDVPGKLRLRPGLSYYTADDASTFSDTIQRVVENVSPWSPGGTWYGAASPTLFAAYEGGFIWTGAVSAPTFSAVDVMSVTDNQIAVLDETGLREFSLVFGGGPALDTAITGTPKGGYLTLSRRDSRVVIAGSTTGSTAARAPRVNFGQPDLPFSAFSEYVDLDGTEAITGAVSLGDLVIIPRETHAAVFYGSTTSATGTPIFHYRTVDFGDRIAYSFTCPPGRFSSDGTAVYFAAGRGVYAFNGSSNPTLISEAIADLWESDGWGLDPDVKVCATPDRIYVGGRDSGGTLVLDRETGKWTVYSFVAPAMFPAAGITERGLYVGDSRLTVLSPSNADDFGAAIDWSYQSGKYPVSERGRVAATQTTTVTGTGTLDLHVSTETYAGSPVTVALGATETEQWPEGVDQEGKLFQHALSGSGPFEVSRLTHHVQSVRPAGHG